METGNSKKRSRWMLALYVFAVFVVQRVISRVAKQAPPEQRWLWFLSAMGIVAIPIGFVYGRNSARSDQLGKIARVFACGAGLCVVIGLVVRGWLGLAGIGAGYLLGFAVGRLVANRSKEKFGDSLEADQYLNPVRSERLPKEEPPCVTYLNSLDQPTRKLVRVLRAMESLGVFAALGFGAWLAFGDRLDVLSRMLFVHRGDGTLFFITPDPIVVGVPLIMLSILLVGSAWGALLSVLAGSRKEAWREFVTLRSSKGGAPCQSKACTVFLLTVLVVSLLAVGLFMDCYLKVTDQGFAMNRFLGIGSKFYRWSDVRDIDVHQEDYVCKHGHSHQRLYVNVVLNDGTAWKPDMSFGRRTADIEKAARYVASRVGR